MASTLISELDALEAWIGRRGEMSADAGDCELLYLILVDHTSNNLERTQRILSQSRATMKFIVSQDSSTGSDLQTIRSLSSAIFQTEEPALLLHPLKLLMLPNGLIGIDVADHMRVWRGRSNILRAVELSCLERAVRKCGQVVAIELSFSSMPLLRLDNYVERVRKRLPPFVDLVWHDMPSRASCAETVDICLAYD